MGRSAHHQAPPPLPDFLDKILPKPKVAVREKPPIRTLRVEPVFEEPAVENDDDYEDVEEDEEMTAGSAPPKPRVRAQVKGVSLNQAVAHANKEPLRKTKHRMKTSKAHARNQKKLQKALARMAKEQDRPVREGVALSLKQQLKTIY